MDRPETVWEQFDALEGEIGRLGDLSDDTRADLADRLSALRTSLEAERLAGILSAVFDLAERERISTHAAAVRIAKEKIRSRKGPW